MGLKNQPAQFRDPGGLLEKLCITIHNNTAFRTQFTWDQIHETLNGLKKGDKMGGRDDEVDRGKEKEEEEQDGMSVLSPCKALPSSASSLSKVSLFFYLPFTHLLVMCDRNSSWID